MHKELLCTAGSSYIVIYPNGDAYRCVKSYNERLNPLGNIISGTFRFGTEIQPCNLTACDQWCDLDWNSQWYVDNSVVVKHRPAKEWNGILTARTGTGTCAALSPQQDLKSFYLIWLPQLVCNYSCSYCGCAIGNNIQKKFPSAFPEKSTEEWISVFSELKKAYEWGILQTSGGEPLLSDATIPVLELLSDKFLIYCYTNLSTRILELTRSNIQPYNPDNDTGIAVKASLHPSAKSFSWHMFLSRLLLLQEFNMLHSVIFVGYPEQLYLYDYYRDILDKHNIHLTIQEWKGVAKQGFSGYLPEEKKYFLLKVNDDRSPDHHIDIYDFTNQNIYQAAFTIEDVKLEANQLSVNVATKNVGISPWTAFDSQTMRGFQLGAKLQRYLKNNGSSLIEYRSPFINDVKQGQRQHMSLNVDLTNLAKKRYRLVIDIVNEEKFWLADLGGHTISLALDYADDQWHCSAAAYLDHIESGDGLISGDS